MIKRININILGRVGELFYKSFVVSTFRESSMLICLYFDKLKYVHGKCINIRQDLS